MIIDLGVGVLFFCLAIQCLDMCLDGYQWLYFRLWDCMGGCGINYDDEVWRDSLLGATTS